MSGRGEDSFVNLPSIAAKLYDSMMQGGATRQQYREIARDLVPRIDRGRLLDIGTGPGRLLLEVHRLNPGIELFGLDVSAAMIGQAKRNLEGVKADLRQGNIRATRYESEFFDLVTCSGSFYLWDNPGEGLEEVHRILKVGCAAYLYETHRDFDSDELLERLRENLREESLIRKLIAPRFLLRQLRMTYGEDEMVEILERTAFARSYRIEKLTIAELPVWVRITLEKRA